MRIRSRRHRHNDCILTTPLGLKHLALMVLLLVTVISESAWAQEWDVESEAEGQSLSQDMDDGWNGEAELVLVTAWNHPEVAAKQFTMSGTHNWDTDVDDMRFLGIDTTYTGRECPPHNPVLVFGQLVESDKLSATESFFQSLAIGAGGIVLGMSLVSLEVVTAGGATPFVIMAGGVAVKAALATNSDDDLGSFGPRVVPRTSQNIVLRGADGSAVIRLWDISSVATDAPQLNCGGPPPAVSLLTPSAATQAVFGNLGSAQTALAALGREPGTFRVTAHGLEQQRMVFSSAVLGVGDFAASVAVLEAAGYQGAQAALDLVLAGHEARSGGADETALGLYQQGYLAALEAIEAAQESTPVSLPSRIALMRGKAFQKPGTSMEVAGWVQGLGTGETVSQISLDGQVGGMESSAIPGYLKTGVALFAALGEDLTAGELVGLGRFSAASVRAADAGCPTPHLVDGTTLQTGVFVDEQGPFFDPDPTGCSFGSVMDTVFPLTNPGVPFGADFSGGLFAVSLSLDENVPPGRYDLEITASINHNGGFSREMTVPWVVIVPERLSPDTLFAADFEIATVEGFS